MVLFIVLYKVVLTAESEDEILDKATKDKYLLVIFLFFSHEKRNWLI